MIYPYCDAVIENHIKKEVEMRKFISVSIVFIVLLNCNCFIFSSYQSAKMLNRGERTVTPSIGGAVTSDFEDLTTVQIPFGVTYGFAPSERVNFCITEGFYPTFSTGSFLNYGSIEGKIGLRRDTSALSSFIMYHIGTGEYEMSLQIGTRFIRTFYFRSGADLTLTPHFGYVLSGYSGPYLGTHVSIGLPVNEDVTVRPEIGIANLELSNWWLVHFGVGLNVSL